MAIPGLTDINIGAQNQAANSDSLWLAFNKVQNNFNVIANTGSNLTTVQAGAGISTQTQGNTVTVVNTGVTRITTAPGSGIVLNANTGDIVISSTGGGGGGNAGGTVTSIGIRSPNSTIQVSPSTPIVTSGFLAVDLPVQSNVIAGNYTFANISVDAFGRITRVANGGAGTVRSVQLTGGTGITVTPTGNATNPAFDITNSGITSITAGQGISVARTGGDVRITNTGGGGGAGGAVSINLIANTFINTAPSSNNLTVTNTEGGQPITGVGAFYIDLKPDVTIDGNFVTANGNITAANGAARANSLQIGFTTSNVVASAGNLTATGNVTANNIVATTLVTAANVTATANVTANWLVSNLAQTTLTTAAQPNITSVGNLTALTVNGTLTANADITLTGNITTANTGSFGNIVVATNANTANLRATGNITGLSELILSGNANISGNARISLNANVTLDANIGGNVILVGNLASGNKSGNSHIIYNNNGNLYGNAKFTFDNAAGNLALTGNINVANGNIIIANGDFTTNGNFFGNYACVTIANAANAQPNITSVGNLVGLRIVGTGGGGNGIGNTFITGGNADQFIRTDGTGNLSFADPEANGTGGNGSVQFANTANANNITFASSANIRWDTANNTFNISNANVIANIATVRESAVFANTGGNAVNINANGVVQITNTTDGNADTGAGALLVSGGIYSQADSAFGGDVTVGATLTAAGNLTGGGGAVFANAIRTNSTDAVLFAGTNIFGGALQVAGSGGVGGDFYVGGNLITNSNLSLQIGAQFVGASPAKTLAGYVPLRIQGSGATGLATRVGDVITSISVTTGGGGYNTTPTVTVDPPTYANGVLVPGGVAATATATLTANAVSSFTVTSGGSGYTSAVIPNVVVSPGAGTNYFIALFT